MTRIIACALLLLVVCLPRVEAQDLTANTLASPAKPKAEKKPKGEGKKQSTDPLREALGGGANSAPKVATTTEILADQAFFDSGKSIGIFTGHVIVTDPRFNLQADKLTVYLGKGEVKGLDHAIAEGNVGMVREAPGEDGGPPTRSVGRADTAYYTAATGDVELRGTPRVQSGLNSHIATSPDTVMVINQGGQLKTNGPSRTELRQEPKTSPAPAPAPPKP